MSYVDGFVIPIPKAKLEEYRQMAELACKVWMEHGALEYQEYIADDVPDGKVTSFPMSVKLKDDETVGFAYARYASCEHRDAVVKSVMADERMTQCMSPENPSFDEQRLIWGGFKPLVGSGG